MLARSQFRTCHSPNQRTTTQGWEGKKAPQGAFLLADKYRMLNFFPHETIKDHVAVFTGDICNLACVLCEPSFSTRWQYELSTQTKKIFELEHTQDFDFTNYNSVLLTGGEPLLNSATLLILKQLDKKVDVKIHMNGTVLPTNEFLETCTKFEHISFIFSIDSTEEQFEFLRYPATWNQVQDNILTIKNSVSKNVSLGVLTVISILNQNTYSRVGQWVRANMDPLTAWNTQDSNGILCRHSYKDRVQEYVDYLDKLDVKRKSNWRQLFPDANKLLQY